MAIVTCRTTNLTETQQHLLSIGRRVWRCTLCDWWTVDTVNPPAHLPTFTINKPRTGFIHYPADGTNNKHYEDSVVEIHSLDEIIYDVS